MPSSLLTLVQAYSPNNYLGEILKVLMITSSGAEGISLQNVRYVHIMEPYWHPVRVEQVIGRARRICSHKNLPKELQTVEVFLYIMRLSQEQLESQDTLELRTKDKSKMDKTKVVTSDEYLYDVALMKKNITQSILHYVKESSIDCLVHSTSNNKENIKCFSIGNPNKDEFLYTPNIADQKQDKDVAINVEKQKIKLTKLPNTKYVFDKATLKVYELEGIANKPLLKGHLTKEENGKYKLHLT